MSDTYARIASDGLWDNNVVFGQMLALCPLLAVTGTATNGLGMGLATTAVLIASGLAVSLLRHVITPDIRIPAFVLLIACIVTVVDMALNAWSHDLRQVLGLFIPLIVTNCAILGRAEAFELADGDPYVRRAAPFELVAVPAEGDAVVAGASPIEPLLADSAD